MKIKYLASPCLAITLITIMLASGCTLFPDYYALSYDEKDHYAHISDQMTLDQRMTYLEKPTQIERETYLREIGLIKPEETQTALDQAWQSGYNILPTDQERFDKNNLKSRKLTPKEKNSLCSPARKIEKRKQHPSSSRL